MRVIIAILFIISINSQAQIINASQPYRPLSIASSCSFLFDTYPAIMGYSLRKFDCDYTGYSIRVRRSSDNTEQDFGFTGEGDLDTASLKSFVGSDSGLVVKAYNQGTGGSTYDAVQSTKAYQPIIAIGGVIQRKNTKPSMYSDGYRYLTVTLASTLSQPNSFFIACSYSGADNRHLTDGVGISPAYRNAIGAYSGLILYGGAVLTFGSNTTNFALYTAVFNGSSSKVQRNNAGTVTGNAGSSALSSFNIGKGVGDVNQNAITGYISEFIVYNSDKGSDFSNINSVINSYYSIY